MPSPYPVTRGVGRRGLTQRKLSPGNPGRFITGAHSISGFVKLSTTSSEEIKMKMAAD